MSQNNFGAHVGRRTNGILAGDDGGARGHHKFTFNHWKSGNTGEPRRRPKPLPDLSRPPCFAPHRTAAQAQYRSAQPSPAQPSPARWMGPYWGLYPVAQKLLGTASPVVATPMFVSLL